MKIGLVGGVASGKTTVAKHYMEKHGCGWVNADAFAHKVLEMPAVIDAVQQRWPEVVSDGKIHRRPLGKIVFANHDDLAFLEGVMQPHVRRLIKAEIEALADKPHIILDIPLLYESGYDKLCDVVIYCSAYIGTRFKRYVARGRQHDPTFDPILEELVVRDNAHLPPSKKRQMAHHVIDTEQPVDDVQHQADRLLRLITAHFTIFSVWPTDLLLEQAKYRMTPPWHQLGRIANVKEIELQLCEELRRRDLGPKNFPEGTRQNENAS